MNDSKNDEQKKVLYISRVFPKYRFEILKYVSRASSYNFHIAYSPLPVPGTKVNSVNDASPLTVHGLRWKGFALPLAGRNYSVGFFSGLIPLLNTLKPDVILTEAESNFIVDIIIMFYSFFTGVPYVLWGCGRVRNTKETWVRKMAYPFLKLLFSRAAAVIGYSNYAVSYYSGVYKLPKEKCFWAPNSLPNNPTVDNNLPLTLEVVKKKWGIDNETVVLLFVGAVTKEKNLDLLFNIFRKVNVLHQNTKLIFIGGGEYLEELQKRYSDMHGVHFLGPVYDGVDVYFRLADIFVLPGLGGLAMQQALQSGLPIVCSVADGTELDMVQNGRNGYFLESDSPEERWVSNISKLISSSELRKEFSLKSLQIAEEEFNASIMKYRIEQALDYAYK